MYLKHLSLLKEAFVIYLVNIFIPTNNLNVDLGINMYPLVMIKICRDRIVYELFNFNVDDYLNTNPV